MKVNMQKPVAGPREIKSLCVLFAQGLFLRRKPSVRVNPVEKGVMPVAWAGRNNAVHAVLPQTLVRNVEIKLVPSRRNALFVKMRCVPRTVFMNTMSI